MQVLPNLFKLWPWVDLALFNAEVKFGHIGFCMGKSENYHFLIIIAALGLKCAWSIQLNELWSWVSIKGQGHSFTLVKGHSDFKVKTCFSQKQLGDLEPKFIWKLKGKWEWKFIQMSRVTLINMAAMPIYGKNLKKIFSRTNRLMTLKLSM